LDFLWCVNKNVERSGAQAENRTHLNGTLGRPRLGFHLDEEVQVAFGSGFNACLASEETRDYRLDFRKRTWYL